MVVIDVSEIADIWYKITYVLSFPGQIYSNCC